MLKPGEIDDLVAFLESRRRVGTHGDTTPVRCLFRLGLKVAPPSNDSGGYRG